jgi:hypothetical protein
MIKLTERQFQLLDLRNNPLKRPSRSLDFVKNLDPTLAPIAVLIAGSEIRGFRNLEARGLGKIVSIAPSNNWFFSPTKDLIQHVDAIVKRGGLI